VARLTTLGPYCKESSAQREQLLHEGRDREMAEELPSQFDLTFRCKYP
jgi:hypothetical protein